MLKYLKTQTIPFYPLLIGIYAVLFLWSANISQVMLNDTLRSLGVSFGLSLGIYLICLLLVRNRHKAALITGWLLIVLFFYGHLFSLVDGTFLGRHRFFYPLLGLLSVVFIFFILRVKRDLHTLSSSLNLIGLVMLLLVIVPIGYYQVRYASQLYTNKNQSTLTPNSNQPDVYYIILDHYARLDILADEYHYDNSAFYQSLKQLGFYLPDCAFSNYPTTVSSLSSSMNMVYLDKLGINPALIPDFVNPAYAPLIINSQLRQKFETMGYKTVAFQGTLPALDLKNADTYLAYATRKENVDLLARLTFERMQMRTSALRSLVEAYEQNPDKISFLPQGLLSALNLEPKQSVDLGRLSWLQSRYIMDTLPTVPDLPGKKFVYAHFYSAHLPYVFDRNGAYTSEEFHQTQKSYPAVVEYTSKRILEIVQTILKKSAVKPIIIIQADHGNSLGLNHNKILNAYYFPDGDYSRLYSTITPVNTFRVVLDQFFGGNYPLLPDEIFASDSADLKKINHFVASCDLK